MSYDADTPDATADPSPDALGRIADPADYKQRRRVQEVMDAAEAVLKRRSDAYELFWNGHIGYGDYLKALRMAVEDYIYISENTVKRHEYAQWYWRGEPPTFSGASPYKMGEDGQYAMDEDNLPILNALQPDDTVTVPESDEEANVRAFVNEFGTDRLKKPVLVWDDDGKLPFGTDLCVLGFLKMAEVDDDGMTFIGLSSIVECPDPIERVSDGFRNHPQKLKERHQEKHQYQIPKKVSINAYRLLNDFWESAGLGMDTDEGLPGQFNVDPSRGSYGHLDTLRQ